MELGKTIVLLILTTSVSTVQRCCRGDAHLVLATKKCNDGFSPLLECKKYLLKPEKGKTIFTVDEEGGLTVENKIDRSTYTLENGSYCLSKLSEFYEDEVALACFEEYDEPFWELRGGCAIVSVIFFILVLIVYSIVPNLRDLQGKCTMHAIANLAIAFVILTIMQLSRTASPTCEILGFSTYFFFLAAFFWLNVICFHVWKCSVRPSMPLTQLQLFRLSLCYGYGLPIILLIIALVTHHVPGQHIKPGIGTAYCWFNGDKAKWVYFYIPISFVLVSNIIMFCWTAVTLWKNVAITSRQTTRLRALRAKCILYVKLSVVMGVTWIFEVLSFIFNDSKSILRYVWVIFDYINILQGLIIFLVLIVFRKRALKGIAEKGIICCEGMKEFKDDESDHTDIFCANADELKELNGDGKIQNRIP